MKGNDDEDDDLLLCILPSAVFVVSHNGHRRYWRSSLSFRDLQIKEDKWDPGKTILSLIVLLRWLFADIFTRAFYWLQKDGVIVHAITRLDS